MNEIGDFEFEKMEKTQSKLSVGVYGPSGSGKTTACFKIAMGIRDAIYPGENLKDIGLFIDTERRSSTKAVGRNVGGETLEPLELYSFEPPYDVVKLYELLKYAISKGKKIIIIDSYTHFWSGQDGILDNVANLENSGRAGKLYGAWSEKEIIHKKVLLKNLMHSDNFHTILAFRAKTEYVIETNFKGKAAPKAIGVKEDTQADVRYEFDAFLSLDRETHNMTVAKDNIGFEEIKLISGDSSPVTIEDGRILAKIVHSGYSLAELNEMRSGSLIKFILDEKLHKSSRVTTFETSTKIELTEEFLKKQSLDKLRQITKYLKGE